MPSSAREFLLVFDGRVDGRLKRAAAETAQKLSGINKQIRQLQKAQVGEGMSADLIKARKDADALRKSLSGIEWQRGRMARLDSAIAKNNQRTTDARGKLVDAGAMALTLAQPMREAMAFESQMADVRKVVDGMNDPRIFKGMSQAIIDLSTKGKIPQTAEGLAQMVAAGGQAGIARKDLIPFARDAAKMGIAFDISADEAGQSMAQWRTAFSMNQKQVVALADQINYLSDRTAASAPQVSAIVTRIGPLGKVGGLAAGQIAALGASMASMGIEPEIAATGIKKVITTLTAGSAATKLQTKAFGALHLNTLTMAKSMQKDATGAIMSVFRALQKLPKAQQVSAMKQLFGEEGLAAVASLLPALDSVEKNFQLVGSRAKWAGSMQTEFVVRSATSANSLQLIKNQAAAAGLKVGNVLLPELVKLMNIVGPIIDRFAKWTEQNPKLFSNIVKVTAALVALRIAMLAGNYGALVIKGGLLDMMSVTIRAARFLRLATVAQWGFNLASKAFSAGPMLIQIGLIVAGILVIIRTVKEAIRWWNAFQQARVARQQAAEGAKIANAYVASGNHSIRLRDEAAARAGGFGRQRPQAHARGGIVNRPTFAMLGEAGREAVIPLQGYRDRAAALFNQVGEQLGFSGSGGININYSPQISIAGSANKGDVDAALMESESRFEAMIRRYFANEARRAMA